MPWVYLLLALGALAIALKTTSSALAIVCLLVALALLLFWVLGLLASRVEASSRDASMIVDPMELKRLREQAEARRLAQSAGRDASSSTTPAE